MFKKLVLSGLMVVSVLAIMAVGVNAIANSNDYSEIQPFTVITRTGEGTNSIILIPSLNISTDNISRMVGYTYAYNNRGFSGTLPRVSFSIVPTLAWGSFRGMVSCFVSTSGGGNTCR